MVDKEYQIIAKNYDLAGRASSDIKRTLKSAHLPQSLIKRICAASFEAEINVVIHSVGGYATFQMDEEKIVIEYIDDGPGIPNLELAMTEGFSTANEIDHANGFGAGMGLPNIKRTADHLEIRTGAEGTHLIIMFFLEGLT